jgi:hypothetical protein
MQGLAAANANSAAPFTTAGRVEQVGTRGCAVIADHFFACEGNVPLLTVKPRVLVVPRPEGRAKRGTEPAIRPLAPTRPRAA